MATPQQKSSLNIVFGAMTIGKAGVEQTRVHTLGETAAILDVFQRHGHNEIDTSRYYGQGSSEEFLGDLDWQKRGLAMDTKYYPTAGRGMPGPQTSHKPAELRENLMASLKALKCEKIDMWYLHGPDRTTPYAETLEEVDKLYSEGYFKRFAISNYMAWEVAQINELCIKNGWVRPSVYQGVYNAIHRSVEAELFPCLRHYGMAFYNYNPLAGGYLTDRYHREQQGENIEKGSRFDPYTWQGKGYRARYWNDSMFDALEILRPVAKEHGLTEAECALRWMTHHSLLKRENGDAVIIGASSTKHLEDNLVDLEKGPLPDEVVKAFDAGWEKTRGISGRYWH
ncbi:hypothetical protein LTR70_007599 [Exophiala xenobiotica]|uniref:NADP-dependent oxidoreductase domain-containing protein n=1 Tax=Lithohypha guttulata TaxID=1690604 RepID=A0ABR0JYW9_9EURO|nr:hypothetical protein LTR24_008956 [Lithohypha guttulata]KAK5313526.1 hypothetical protein LTR70_007599 [Exophiala xenobiotica]